MAILIAVLGVDCWIWGVHFAWYILTTTWVDSQFWGESLTGIVFVVIWLLDASTASQVWFLLGIYVILVYSIIISRNQ